MKPSITEEIPARLAWGGVKLCIEEMGGMYGKAACLIFDQIVSVALVKTAQAADRIRSQRLRKLVIEIKCKLEGLKNEVRNQYTYLRQQIESKQGTEAYDDWGTAARAKFLAAHPKPDEEFKEHFYWRHIQRLEFTIARAYVQSHVVVERYLEQVHDFKSFTSHREWRLKHNLKPHETKYLNKFNIYDENDLLRWGAQNKR